MMMNGKKLESLEDIKRNLAIDELIDSYFSGELDFFLREEAGEIEKAEKIAQIPVNNAFLLIRLYMILGIEPDIPEELVRESAV